MAWTFAEAFRKAGIDIPEKKPNTTDEIYQIICKTLKEKLEKRLDSKVNVLVSPSYKITGYRSDTGITIALAAGPSVILGNGIFIKQFFKGFDDICDGNITTNQIVESTIEAYKRDILDRFFRSNKEEK